MSVLLAYRIIMESRDENNSASENSESEVEIDNIDDNDEEDGPVEVGLEAQNVSVRKILKHYFL